MGDEMYDSGPQSAFQPHAKSNGQLSPAGDSTNTNSTEVNMQDSYSSPAAGDPYCENAPDLNSSDSSRGRASNLSSEKDAYSTLLGQAAPVPAGKHLGRRVYDAHSDRRPAPPCPPRRAALVCAAGLLMLVLGAVLLVYAVFVLQNKDCRTHGQLSQNASQTPDVQGQRSQVTKPPSVVELTPELENAVKYVQQRVNSSRGHAQNLDLGENLALRRPASQSSTADALDNTPLNASLAVDGRHDNRIMRKSCAQTKYQRRPHWMVDLQQLSLVSGVRLVIPRDCCVGQLHNFEVRVGQSRHRLQGNPLCKHYLGTALPVSQPVTVRCDRQVYGRYVSIQMLGDKDRPLSQLSLCEVTVHS